MSKLWSFWVDFDAWYQAQTVNAAGPGGRLVEAALSLMVTTFCLGGAVLTALGSLWVALQIVKELK